MPQSNLATASASGAAEKASNSSDAIRRANEKYKSDAARAATGWKGDAGSAFKDLNRALGRHMSSVLTGYGSLCANLNRLACSEKRAESEEERSLLPGNVQVKANW